MASGRFSLIFFILKFMFPCQFWTQEPQLKDERKPNQTKIALKLVHKEQSYSGRKKFFFKPGVGNLWLASQMWLFWWLHLAHSQNFNYNIYIIIYKIYLYFLVLNILYGSQGITFRNMWCYCMALTELHLKICGAHGSLRQKGCRPLL